MKERRLLKLAEFLEALPPKRFDYTVFVGTDWKGAPDLSCGTTACALGWAATMPAFRRLGLRLTEWEEGGIATVVDTQTEEEDECAAERIFGLTYQEANWLFIPGIEGESNRPQSRATPKQVAKHIRNFVRNGGPKFLYDVDNEV